MHIFFSFCQGLGHVPTHGCDDLMQLDLIFAEEAE